MKRVNDGETHDYSLQRSQQGSGKAEGESTAPVQNIVAFQVL